MFIFETFLCDILWAMNFHLVDFLFMLVFTTHQHNLGQMAPKQERLLWLTSGINNKATRGVKTTSPAVSCTCNAIRIN
jgi:hypothetical protein